MKKLFQIGLLLLLFVVALAVVPQRSGTTYQDAEIQPLSPDQINGDLMALDIAAENYSFNQDVIWLCASMPGIVVKDSKVNIQNSLLYTSARVNDVTDNCTQLMEGCFIKGPKIFRYDYTSNRAAILNDNQLEGLFRLDIGEKNTYKASTNHLVLTAINTYRQPRDGLQC